MVNLASQQQAFTANSHVLTTTDQMVSSALAMIQ
jgi:flagellar basal body rod protein FlgC